MNKMVKEKKGFKEIEEINLTPEEEKEVLEVPIVLTESDMIRMVYLNYMALNRIEETLSKIQKDMDSILNLAIDK